MSAKNLDTTAKDDVEKVDSPGKEDVDSKLGKNTMNILIMFTSLGGTFTHKYLVQTFVRASY